MAARDFLREDIPTVELTTVFGGSKPTPNPETHSIECFEDGIALIESGAINGFECYCDTGVWHSEAVLYRVRRWGQNAWQFKLVHHGLEGSGTYASSWEELIETLGEYLDTTFGSGTTYRAI